MTTDTRGPMDSTDGTPRTPVRRALVSVYDKTGLEDLARGLAAAGVEIVSTGSTAKTIAAEGVPVTAVGDVTGFPECLDGRVKTLHPHVHGGLLADLRKESHRQQLDDLGIAAFELVIVNLYPFEQTVASGASVDECVEQIDIGGPAMVRASAKNYANVAIVTSPARYEQVLAAVAGGGFTLEERAALAVEAFSHTATYDTAVASWLGTVVAPDAEGFPQWAGTAFRRGSVLRYGENPHQQAAVYLAASGEPGIAGAQQYQGKEMSYNNYVDGEGALEAVKDLSGKPGVAVIKHTNPCGYATGETLAEAFEAAWSGDPVSAFGSVIAVTEKVDLATAELLKGRFIEALIAPDFDADALEFLKSKSKNIRLLKLHKPMSKAAPRKMIKDINGGVLVQDVDTDSIAEWKDVTKTAFDQNKRALAEFGIAAAKHTKSNAIMVVQEYKAGQFRVLGMGAGQPNRVDSLRKLAVPKAIENLKLQNPEITDEQIAKTIGECVFVSEAFFPFADSIDEAHAVGARFIVQPGGSIRDDEVIAACDKHGIAMAFTGMRHFKH